MKVHIKHGNRKAPLKKSVRASNQKSHLAFSCNVFPFMFFFTFPSLNCHSIQMGCQSQFSPKHFVRFHNSSLVLIYTQQLVLAGRHVRQPINHFTSWMSGFNIIGVTETKIANSNPFDCWLTIPSYDFQYVSAPLAIRGIRMSIDSQEINRYMYFLWVLNQSFWQPANFG